MSNNKAKWLLAAVVICCLAPGASAERERGRDRDQGCDPRRDKHCQQVPEGGSTAIYLLGAGLTFVGAMFVRSRIIKPVAIVS
jgi:hypothetical protein